MNSSWPCDTLQSFYLVTQQPNPLITISQFSKQLRDSSKFTEISAVIIY